MMQMPIPDALAQALGWTLVHSLWQATLIALVLMLLLPRLRSPQARYRAAYGALLTVLMAAVGTFVWSYSPTDTVGATVDDTDFNLMNSSDLMPDVAANALAFPALSQWLETHYPVVVTLWLVGFGLFLLRLGGGLFYINRLRREGLFLVETEWQERVAHLSERLALSRPVALFQSALVHAPVALGYLKPMVLLPVGLLNQLDPAEVEAVLAHELAHIARRDWLFNLLQAFIESVFYFHPAVWWMSGIVRREREDCCDDTAVALCGNPLHYAKALLRVQEMAVSAPAAGLALGLDGGTAAPAARRRMFLLERVRRILNQPQHKSHNMEKSVATAVLLALLLFVGLRANTPQVIQSAFAQISDIAPDFLTAQTDDYQMLGDSLPKPKGKQKITREDDSRRVEAEYQDGQVTRLNIDGKDIPAAEFGQHRDLTDGLLRESTPPPPPAPPTPPSGWNWGDAPASPAPPTPPGGWNWENTPAAPPVPPTPPRISTLKNGDGTTILHIENGGEAPVVIKIKDGETWVDGKKLTEGESLDLPGLSGQVFTWGDGDAQGYHFEGLEGLEGGLEGLRGLEGLKGLEGLGDLESLRHLNKEELEEAIRAQRQAIDELRRARGLGSSGGHGEGHGRSYGGYAPEDAQAQKRRAEETYRDMEGRRKQLEKEMKQQQKEMERVQKEGKKQMEAAMREHERAMREHEQTMREHEKGMREHERAMRETREKMTEQTAYWGNQLRSDGLVSDAKNFSMKLSAKSLSVDGKKQSDDLHRKYLELYEQRTGGKNKLSGNSTFSINANE